MTLPRRIAVAGVALLLCVGGKPARPNIDDRIGSAAAERLRNFKSVEVFLQHLETDDETYSRWVIDAKKELGDGTLAKKLAATLLDKNTFGGSTISCFDPWIGLRVTGPAASDPPLEILICFHCIQMQFSMGGQEKMVPFNTKGPLKALLRQAFPKQDIDDYIGNDED